MERYIVKYRYAVKYNGRIKWYIHSRWDNKQDAERVAARLRRRWQWDVKITTEPVGVWGIVRHAAWSVWEWFVAEGAHALGEVLAGASLLVLLMLLPFLAG